MKKVSSAVDKTTNHGSVFISLALDMSWRLAIVVLVPVIGGFELDQRLKTSPLLTVVGFLLAMGGMAIVLWQTLQTANRMPVPKAASKEEKH